MNKTDSHAFSHEAMATSFQIAISGKPAGYARQAAAAAFRELDRLEGELSRFVESSDIAQANRLGAGKTITLGDDALQCLVAAAEVSAATGRAFDPAYATMRDSATESDAVLFALDPAGHTLTSLTDRLHLDLGAVGKGYALDRLADLLREWEITSACLQSGGSTALALAPPPGEPGWPVGLGDGAHYRIIALAGCALSGSGLAVKGSHLIDPRTGRPAVRAGRVWSLAPSAAVADALSTAFFVMNDAEVAAFCAARPEFGAVLAASDGSLAVYGAARAL